MLVMESILRDRLGHFKLEKDTYNTHLYELKQDYTLAQKNMLCLQNGGDVARVRVSLHTNHMHIIDFEILMILAKCIFNTHIDIYLYTYSYILP